MTGAPQPRRTTAPARAWRHAWPVLAGAVLAVGLVGTWRLTSLLAVVAMAAGLWLFLAVMLYGVGSESGLRLRTAVRVGLVASVWTLTLLGLVGLFPVAGWLVAIAVGVSSPALTDWAGPHLARATDAVGRSMARPAQPDRDAVDRAFGEIVADIENDAA
jgi:hypothetical protein